MPFDDLRACLGQQLALGIGGDDNPRIHPRIQPPFDQHRDQRRLADAMTRSTGDTTRRELRGGVAEMGGDCRHDVTLPFARA